MSKSNLLPIAVILVGWVQNSGASTELAKINQSVITLEDFQKKYTENLKYFPHHPPSKKEVLEDLIRKNLALEEAKKEGFNQKPEFIDQQESLLFNLFIEKKLSENIEKIQVSEEEAKNWYQRSPVIRTSHILVKVPLKSTPSDEKKALEKLERIESELKRKKFDEVARLYSEAPSAPLGGDMDFQSKDRLNPTYYRSALELAKVGQISNPVRTPFGFHIILLTGKKTWEEVDHHQVKRSLLEEKKRGLFETYMKSLKQKAKIEIHSELIQD